MHSTEHVKRHHLPTWVFGLLLLALVMRGVIVFENAASLVNFIPDDSYYYYIPVRHLLNGNGISFDGETPTNGFHPLWFGVLVPVFALSGPLGEEAPILASMLIGGAFAVGAGYLLWWAVRHLTGEPLVAGIMLILFLFNPALVGMSINGLETSLHLFCSALLVCWVVRLFEQPSWEQRDWLILGVFVGLTFLARTDSVILIGLLVAVLFLARLTPERFRQLLLAGSIAALLALPWLAWNYGQFGTIMQSSGTSLTDYARGVWRTESGDESPLPQLIALAGFNLNTVLRRAGFSFLTLLVLGLPALLAALNRRRLRRTGIRLLAAGEGRWLALAILYVLAYVGFHSVVRWFMREWYFASVLLMLYMVFAILGALLLRLLRPALARMPGLPAPARGAGIGLVLFLALVSGWAGELDDPNFRFWGRPEKYPWQQDMLDGGLWLKENGAETTRVGSFNAGILAYYSGRAVINLDGVMNYAIQPYIRESRMLCYMAEADLDLLADFRLTFNSWEPFFVPDRRLNPLAEFRILHKSTYWDQAQGGVILQVDKERIRALTGCQP